MSHGGGGYSSGLAGLTPVLLMCGVKDPPNRMIRFDPLAIHTDFSWALQSGSSCTGRRRTLTSFDEP